MENTNHAASEPDDAQSKKSAKNDVFDNLPYEIKQFWETMEKSSFNPLNFDFTSIDNTEWVDIEKFKRGQKFAIDNFYSISYMVIHALLMLLTDRLAVKSFIFAKSVTTAEKYEKRLLSLCTSVKSWFEYDVLGKELNTGIQKLRRTRKMHKLYHYRIMSSSDDKLAVETYLDVTKSPWELNLHKSMQKDFQNNFPNSEYYMRNAYRKSKLMVSQASVSITLFGLVGLPVTYPEYYGFFNATDDDLEAYIHLWKTLVFALGVGDECNFANADLETVRRRTKSFFKIWIGPAFREIDEDWEFLARNLVKGAQMITPLPFLTFEAMILDFMNFLGIDCPYTKKCMSSWDYVYFYAIRVNIFLFRIPGYRRLANFMMGYFIKKSEKKMYK